MRHVTTIRTLFIAFLLFGALTSRGDLMVLLTVEDLQNPTPLGKEQITFYISGKRIRLDQGQSMSSIILNDKKVTFSIMHEPRQYVALPHDEIKIDPSKSKTSEFSTTEPLEKSAFEPTGKIERISGFQCHQVWFKEKNGDRTELWIAENALDMKVFLQEFKSFAEFGFNQTLKELEKYPAINGIPIRIIEYSGSKMLRRATINRLETAKIQNSIFEVPAGYAEMKISDFPLIPPPVLEESLKHLKK